MLAEQNLNLNIHHEKPFFFWSLVLFEPVKDYHPAITMPNFSGRSIETLLSTSTVSSFKYFINVFLAIESNFVFFLVSAFSTNTKGRKVSHNNPLQPTENGA